METTTRTGAVINDRRTDEDKAATIGFIVATDKFMSGWGGAPRRSLFAVPVRNREEIDIVEENMRRRREMKRVRFVSADWRPRLQQGDHLSIATFDGASRFYVKGGF